MCIIVCFNSTARHKTNVKYENLAFDRRREKSDKEFVMRLVFDPRVGLKTFITSSK